ncbi:Hypothetical predicted protein [Mytilus galloprovincialis]|uniref:Uncharacterized protein n=1 Tax=Mytilus galloprovincialis TaxID=29158 RepID=A0A8B6D1R5_MYTGA|nr:Hypothetical predicted protein [Mytilus galloprovincialis]
MCSGSVKRRLVQRSGVEQTYPGVWCWADLSIEENQNTLSLKEGILQLKDTQVEKRTHFEDYLKKIENTNSTLKTELDQTKKELEKQKNQKIRRVKKRQNRKETYQEHIIQSVVGEPKRRR